MGERSGVDHSGGGFRYFRFPRSRDLSEEGRACSKRLRTILSLDSHVVFKDFWEAPGSERREAEGLVLDVYYVFYSAHISGGVNRSESFLFFPPY